MKLPPNDKLKLYSLLIAGVVALWCVFVMGWCTITRVYIDVPMLLVLSNLVMGIVSCITTVLVGRTLAQLNQPGDSETTVRQTTETVTTPKAALPGNIEVVEQPKVAVIPQEPKTES